MAPDPARLTIGANDAVFDVELFAAFQPQPCRAIGQPIIRVDDLKPQAVVPVERRIVLKGLLGMARESFDVGRAAQSAKLAVNRLRLPDTSKIRYSRFGNSRWPAIIACV